MRGLEGKVALITGGGRGIGRGTALRLAEEGVSGLVLNDIDEEPLHEVVQKAKSLGVQAVSLAGSVTDSALATKLVKLATDTFGDLHCVVTSAGFPWGGVIHKVTDEQWQTIIDVHLTGTFWVVREAMGFMRERAKQELERGNGPIARKIVTVSSGAAQGAFGNVNYSAAKAGLHGLTRTASAEGAAFNILVNSVSFSIIDTRLTQAEDPGETVMGRPATAFPREMRDEIINRVPLKRSGTVDEAAGSIVFLLSDDANFITGHTLEVNGGRR